VIRRSGIGVPLLFLVLNLEEEVLQEVVVLVEAGEEGKMEVDLRVHWLMRLLCGRVRLAIVVSFSFFLCEVGAVLIVLSQMMRMITRIGRIEASFADIGSWLLLLFAREEEWIRFVRLSTAAVHASRLVSGCRTVSESSSLTHSLARQSSFF